MSWLFGGNMAMRKVVFEERGLFDEELSGFGSMISSGLATR